MEPTMWCHFIQSDQTMNLIWVITECPSLGSSQSWEIVFECHEDAAKVELCKIKEKEGRKEGRKSSFQFGYQSWIIPKRLFHFETSQDMIPSVPHLYSLQIGSWPICPTWVPESNSKCMYVCMYVCMQEQVIGKINLPVMKAQALLSVAQEKS